jgi:plasmid maintenance system antidote protein VapI
LIVRKRLCRNGLAARASVVTRGAISATANHGDARSGPHNAASPHHLGTSARSWVNLQTGYDLVVAEPDHGARIAAEVDRAA